MKDINKTKVYFNNSKEDIEAIKLLREKEIGCRFIGPMAEIKTPVLIHNSQEYHGLKGISVFINDISRKSEK